MRTAAAGARATLGLLCAALFVLAGCTKSAPHPEPPPVRDGIAMRIDPADATYARGKPVQFSIVLTNGQAQPCQISRLPEGGLTVLSLTRDGAAIPPTLVRGTTVAGFANLLLANLVPLSSGASVSVPWASEGGSSAEDRAALRTSMMDDMDQPMLAFWPTGEPGRYEISLRYAPPPLPGGPTDACPATGEPAHASFTVTGG